MENLSDHISQLQFETSSLEISGEEFYEYCQEALNYLVPFINQVGNAPAMPELSANSILSELKTTFHEPLTPLQRLIATQLDRGIETASGNFMGYVPGGGVLTSALADFVISVTNRYTGLHFGAPGNTESENKVIKWFCDLFEMGGDAWGCLTSGGTHATLTCLLAARESVEQIDINNLVIYMTNQAHFAIRRSLKVMGLHHAHIHFVRTCNDLSMDSEDLDASIQTHLDQGLHPFLIITSAGTTNTGSVDPLESISEIADKHKVWMHVDAAYGGMFVLTEVGKKTLKGIENADSIVVDPHKGMFLAYGVGVALVKKQRFLKSAFHEDAEYLSRPDTKEAIETRSPVDYSLEMTRHNRAPRISLSLDLLGIECFKSALLEKHLLACWLHQQLELLDGVIIFAKPRLSVVAFRLAYNLETEKLLASITEDGLINVSSTRLGETIWIRACILNFRTHMVHVEHLLEKISRFISCC
ncbi:pyridoxal phosphate-dependent decarboxylase family protein [Legionella worsleiensis]|uniref:Pyridoxal-dependent decarboxylase n=1 Tax=Legionella worsleiensis TaxID=45076 RepID=A0A0W1AJD9_9GAMM|nr:aminotransferase class V-fold PLP-dependent enzyme [Legionella worsleiensis]KTD81410.1 pyridoxal-dependent decarboxylase [Legionella worsleiensis]STY30083.1 pyridoxal-dependent decarboxylase [Legionella worsleiensis]